MKQLSTLTRWCPAFTIYTLCLQLILYFLDEPEAALSPQRQLILLMEINRCAEQGAQFMIVTHSPILPGIPGAQILNFDEGVIHPCNYEDTGSYQVTSMFINNRGQILHMLLDRDIEC